MQVIRPMPPPARLGVTGWLVVIAGWLLLLSFALVFWLGVGLIAFALSILVRAVWGAW